MKNRLAIPHCIPLVIGESGAPKQTAQASTSLGQTSMIKAMKSNAVVWA